MPTQVHDPHKFALAYRLIQSVIGDDPERDPLFHRSVWVEATPTATTLHASNIDVYVRASVPALRPGSTWRSVAVDTRNKLPVICAMAKNKRVVRSLWAEFEETLQISLTDKTLKFELVGVSPKGKVDHQTVDLQRRDMDVDWPHKIVGLIEQHHPTKTDGFGLSLPVAAAFHQIMKTLSTPTPTVPRLEWVSTSDDKGVLEVEHQGVRLAVAVYCAPPATAPSQAELAGATVDAD